MRTPLALGLGIACLLLGVATPLHAQEDDEFMQELLGEADTLFAERATSGKAEEALEMYEKILALDPDYVTTYWKIARTYYWLGQVRDGDEAKLAAFKEGIDFAKLGLEKDKQNVECHFWLAVLYGKFGEVKGVMQSLHMVPHMKEELNKVIDMDPEYYSGGAYRTLGRLQHKLPGIQGGDNDEAIELLKKAIEIGPANLKNHRFLAEVYLDEGMDEEARAELEKVLQMPDEPGYEPESAMEREAAKALLAELDD